MSSQPKSKAKKKGGITVGTTKKKRTQEVAIESTTIPKRNPTAPSVKKKKSTPVPPTTPRKVKPTPRRPADLSALLGDDDDDLKTAAGTKEEFDAPEPPMPPMVPPTLIRKAKVIHSSKLKFVKKVPKALQKLVSTHEIMLKKDIKVFKGIGCLDDIMRIKTESDRVTKLKAAVQALKAANIRHIRFFEELEKWKPTTPEKKAAKKPGTQYMTLMMLHFPNWFITNDYRKMILKLNELVTIAGLTPKQKETELASTMTPSVTIQTKEKKVFEDICNRCFLKNYNYIDLYSDKPVRSATIAQLQQAQEATDAIVARYEHIIYLGGSVDQAEASVTHIPAELWPDKIVVELQAWRKVEYDLMAERVSNTKVVKKGKLGFVLTAEEIFGLAGDIGDIFGDDIGDMPEIEHAFQICDGLSKLSAIGSQFSEARMNQNDEVAMNSLSTTHVVAFLASAGGVATAIGKMDEIGIQESSASGAWLVEKAPILGAVSSSVDAFVSVVHTHELYKELKVSKEELKKIETAFYIGKSRDRALVNCFHNERDAKNRQTIKAAIESGAEVLGAAGNIVEAAGPAALAIKTVGAGIKYGNKIVFKGIDWNNAKHAKQVLDMAKAGNRLARVQVFKASAFYAKMYIAVAAKDGEKFALAFIENRGATSFDFTRPMALKILRDYLMNKAEQSDDVDISRPVMRVNPDDSPRVWPRSHGSLHDYSTAGQWNLPRERLIIQIDTYTKANFKADIHGAKAELDKETNEHLVKIGRMFASNNQSTIRAAAALLMSTDEEAVRPAHKAALDVVADIRNEIRRCEPKATDGKIHKKMKEYFSRITTGLNKFEDTIMPHLKTLSILNMTWDFPELTASERGSNQFDFAKLSESAKKAYYLLPGKSRVSHEAFGRRLFVFCH